MESGAILAVTTHAGAVADTETLQQTVCEAGVAVSEVLDATGRSTAGVQEVIADKGYHSNDTMRQMRGLELRSYIAEPERGARKWKGKAVEQAAVYANRRRIQGRARQAATGTTGREDRTELCASVRHRRHGPAICTRSRKRTQETVVASGGLLAPEYTDNPILFRPQRPHWIGRRCTKRRPQHSHQRRYSQGRCRPNKDRRV